MRRISVLTAIVAAGTMSYAVSQAAQQPAAAQPKVVEVEKLKDNLYVLKGGGGNTAVFITAQGVVVVDTKNPGWGQPILDAINRLGFTKLIDVRHEQAGTHAAQAARD